MAESIIEISPSALQAGFESILEANAFGEYDSLLTACEQSVLPRCKRGPVPASEIQPTLHIPGIRMIIDATLASLYHDDLAPLIPTEVVDRGLLAADVAHAHADHFAKTKLLRAAYLAHEGMARFWGLIPHKDDELLNAKYLRNFGASPFTEATVIAGGALHLLQQKNILGGHTQIIAYSSGLQRFAKVETNQAGAALGALGYPYVTADHLTLKAPVRPGDLHRVDYAPRTVAMLKRHQVQNSGCPAMQIQEPGGGTALSSAWVELVDYLTPEEATVEYYREEPSPPSHKRQR